MTAFIIGAAVALVALVGYLARGLITPVLDRPRAAFQALGSGVKAAELRELDAARQLWSADTVDYYHRSALFSTGGQLIVDRRALERRARRIARRHRPANVTYEVTESLTELSALFIAREGIEPVINIDSGRAHWDMSLLPPAVLLDFHQQATALIAQSWAKSQARKRLAARERDERDRARREQKWAVILAEAGESLRLDRDGAGRTHIVRKTTFKIQPTTEGKS